MKKPLMVLDVECLPNHFLIGFKALASGMIFQFEAYGEFEALSIPDQQRVNALLDMYTTFGFNSNKYDIPMILYALQGATCLQLHQLSVSLVSGAPVWGLMKQHNLNIPLMMDHFDICEPSPAVMISLKAYGTRIGSKRLWEFFLDPMLPINRIVANEIARYNINDLDTTIDLYNAVKDRIELREQMSEQYGIDLRSKSDAQIAEAVIVSELFKQGIVAIKPELPSDYKARYVAPGYISFKTPQLQAILEEVQNIDFELASNGSLLMPDALAKKVIRIGKTAYKLGIGGLHSQEKSLVVESNETHVMRNADFASYYPFIILNNGLYPKHLGEDFLTVYRSIVERRLEAKRNGNTLVADSLKITINGSFGKFGSKYSKLFSPDLLLATTITGQLTLLMLIEQFEEVGIGVVSANTDGLEYFCPRDKIDLSHDIISYLEFITGYEMECDSYLGLYARDVNNYVAKYEGKVKAKGIYAKTTLSKGLQTPIVFEAVRQYIDCKAPIEETILSCTVVNDFLSARTVKGGALWNIDETRTVSDSPEYSDHLLQHGKVDDKELIKRNKEYRIAQLGGEYLGKMVRWYYSTDGYPIYYRTNGNLVPKTGEGVTPMMDLTETIPDNLNYQWYVNEAIEMLKDLGVTYE